MRVTIKVRMVTMENAVDTVATQCPICGHEFTQASHVPFDQPAFPKTGDVSICIECHNILIYSDDVGHVRKPTAEELSDTLNDTRVIAVLEAMKSL